MTTQPLVTTLGAICKLAEARTVECSICALHSDNCGDHINGGGRIADPAYAGLLSVVQDTAWCTCVHADCSGRAYITRSWDEQPEGALAGALNRWLIRHYQQERMARPANDYAQIFNEYTPFFERLDACLAEDDCDAAAAQVVREWLEKVKP